MEPRFSLHEQTNQTEWFMAWSWWLAHSAIRTSRFIRQPKRVPGSVFCNESRRHMIESSKKSQEIILEVKYFIDRLWKRKDNWNKLYTFSYYYPSNQPNRIERTNIRRLNSRNLWCPVSLSSQGICAMSLLGWMDVPRGVHQWAANVIRNTILLD